MRALAIAWQNINALAGRGGDKLPELAACRPARQCHMLDCRVCLSANVPCCPPCMNLVGPRVDSCGNAVMSPRYHHVLACDEQGCSVTVVLSLNCHHSYVGCRAAFLLCLVLPRGDASSISFLHLCLKSRRPAWRALVLGRGHRHWHPCANRAVNLLKL